MPTNSEFIFTANLDDGEVYFLFYRWGSETYMDDVTPRRGSYPKTIPPSLLRSTNVHLNKTWITQA